MLNLNSAFDYNVISNIQSLTKQRFRDYEKLKAPDALILSEQGYLSDEDILVLCNEVYSEELECPDITFVPERILTYFKCTNLVPVSYSSTNNKVVLLKLPDLEDGILEGTLKSFNCKTEVKCTTPNYYFKVYNMRYGQHEELLTLPAKELFEGIKNEAIELGAADITLTTRGNATLVYYNVRKSKVYSKRVLSAKDLKDIVTMLTIHSPMDSVSRDPKYVDVQLTDYHRGRVLINHTFKGMCVTIRILPQNFVESELEDLSLTNEVISFIRRNCLDTRNGLRLLVGPTMSGKNTTCLATLKAVVDTDRFKVVSIEMPVEQLIDGVEQISCDNEEEFTNNIRTLIHQNPDFIYVAEIRDTTGRDTLHVTNTGKRVLSTLHSNSAYDVITRMVDITGMSTDRVIQTMHSVIYQELVRDDYEDTVAPRCRCIEFTEELKYKLYGKGLGEISRILKEEECGDTWISSTSILS